MSILFWGAVAIFGVVVCALGVYYLVETYIIRSGEKREKAWWLKNVGKYPL